MGHYCYICAEKIVGGVVPTCCNEIECLCWGCWERLLECSMPTKLQQAIKKDILVGGVLSDETTEELKLWTEQDPECPECKSVLTKDMYNQY